MNQKRLEKYAQLIIKSGINVQKGQPLIINSPVEVAPFTRLLVKAAYEAGAKEVMIDWNDGETGKLSYEHMSIDDLKVVPKWIIDKFDYLNKTNTARISISASNPELLKDIEPIKIKEAGKARQIALAEAQNYVMANRVQWCVVSVPTVDWAKKVFPNVSNEEAIEKLWEAILTAVRVRDDNDPVKEWEEHNQLLASKVKLLNQHRFDYLHYKSANGTDFKIHLAQDHEWAGGCEHTTSDVIFNPNLPTEEVFTMPYKTKVDGKVVSTKPLNYGGKLIEDFSLTFKDGKVVEYTAKKNLESLKSLIELDEGSAYLGEVALVPFHSPISLSGVLFYNTLFDENASCHLALGRAYPMNVKNGVNMTKEELAAKGANNSITHVDFMIGAKDLSIIGYDHNGKAITIFKNGDWAL